MIKSLSEFWPFKRGLYSKFKARLQMEWFYLKNNLTIISYVNVNRVTKIYKKK